MLAYGAAGGISAARFVGQQHFATDVLVGSALGWYMGRQVFRSRSHYSDAEIAKMGHVQQEVTNDNGRDARKYGIAVRAAG